MRDADINSCLFIASNNEPGGTRTHDLRIKSPLLYRLSYSLAKAFYCSRLRAWAKGASSGVLQLDVHGSRAAIYRLACLASVPVWCCRDETVSCMTGATGGPIERRTCVPTPAPIPGGT